MIGTFLHGLTTAISLVLVWLVTGDPLLGGMLGVAFWAGNEFSQAEYRAIESMGGERANICLFTGLNPSYWDAKSVADIALPATITLLLWWALSTYPPWGR